MMAFASRTGTRRNLAALRDARWGLLVSAAGVWRTEGFALWVAENGAWSDHQAGLPFNEERYERFLAWVLAQPIRPQWLALPDIVMTNELLASLGYGEGIEIFEAAVKRWHDAARPYPDPGAA